MPQVKLNQRFTDQISVAVGRKKEEWFDLSIRGFYLEVRESGGKTWRLRLTDRSGANRVVSLGDAACVTFEQAREQAKNLRAAAQIGQWSATNSDAQTGPQAVKMSFSEFVETHYLPYASARKRSVQTDISVLRNHLLPAFGETSLSEISRADLVRFHTEKRKQGYAPGTADRMIVLLRHILNLAIKWEVLEKGKNPANQFELFNENNCRERYLSADELETLITALRGSENRDLLNIVTGLLLTGCRRGELLNSRWIDVNFETNIWTIPLTKQGKPHRIPMTVELARFFHSLPSRGKSEYVFPNPATDKPYKSIFYSWDRARTLAGMPELRMHDLRHSFASFLVNGGRSLYEVQRLLGHTSSRTTQRYAHLSQDSLAQAMSIAGKTVLAGVQAEINHRKPAPSQLSPVIETP